MKTLRRARRDLMVDEHTPTVDQSLAENRPPQVLKPEDSSSGLPAAPLRPVAHWVSMPTGGGNSRLEMIWETSVPIAVAIAS